MKRLDCPVDGCTAAFEAETEEEIMDKAADHAAEDHPDMELDDEMIANIRSNILTI